MAQVTVHIPQIGEGLQEARLVAFLKAPGDMVKRDEPIYQMETDKAVMDVESPYEGVLSEWLADVDSILPIGGAVASMEVVGQLSEFSSSIVEPTVASSELNAVTRDSTPLNVARMPNVPPRTRAYAKEKGLSEDQLASLAASGGKLMPSDIDAFLSGHPTESISGTEVLKGAGASNQAYTEAPMPGKQRLLASRLARSASLAVQGTMTVVSHWGPIEAERDRVKHSGSEFKPSAFTMFAYAVAQVLKDYPAFRTSLVADSTLRTYHHVSLGIAVGLPNDELVLAVVEDADTLSWRDFASRMREKIELARTGHDQANESVTISLTNMQSFGLRDAVPVVVPPAVATLFLGEAYTALNPSASIEKSTPTRLANLALSFDHRLINGVGAAEFLNAIKSKVETIGTLVQ